MKKISTNWCLYMYIQHIFFFGQGKTGGRAAHGLPAQGQVRFFGENPLFLGENPLFFGLSFLGKREFSSLLLLWIFNRKRPFFVHFAKK